MMLNFSPQILSTHLWAANTVYPQILKGIFVLYFEYFCTVHTKRDQLLSFLCGISLKFLWYAPVNNDKAHNFVLLRNCLVW